MRGAYGVSLRYTAAAASRSRSWSHSLRAGIPGSRAPVAPTPTPLPRLRGPAHGCTRCEPGYPARGRSSLRPLRRCRGFAVLGHFVELRVLLAGVDPVLELDHAQLGETVAQPAVAGVEQPQLLAVGNDLREEQRLEDRAVGRVLHRLHRLLHVDPEALPRLLLQEPVAHANGGLERELLALLDLSGSELRVVLLERQHPERDVARLVAHDVAQELLEQRLGRHLVQEPEGRQREAL